MNFRDSCAGTTEERQCVTVRAVTKHGQGRGGRRTRAVSRIHIAAKCFAKPVYSPSEGSPPNGERRGTPAQRAFPAAFLWLTQPKQGLKFPIVMVSKQTVWGKIKGSFKKKTA